MKKQVKKSPQSPTKKNKRKPVDLEQDERYKAVISDPLFTEMRRKERKVVIDDRFKGMFTDQRFSTGQSKIDKRGRPIKLGPKTNLENLYELTSDEDKINEEEASTSEDESSEETKRSTVHLDLARGEGNISSSEDESDEEDEMSEIEKTDEVVEADWNQLDRSARRVEWASRRLAICNMDWDRVRADDLLLLLASFKPPEGNVKSLTLYISDFGAEKLAEEEVKGPVLDRLAKKGKKVDLENEEMDEETKAAIRAYQLDRLKYYYAILDCDSEQTATTIYEACDGVEYETSGVRMDLRFVPDDMVFDEMRLKESIRMSDLNVEKYRPKKFENQALANSSAKLTWDETDPHRKQVISEAFNKDKNLDEFEDLIASGSEDEPHLQTPKDALKGLFEAAGIDHNLENNNDEDDLKIEWEPALDESLVNFEPKKENKDDEMTPFQKYLEKKKQKKKEYKTKIKELKKARKQELAELAEETNEKVSEKTKKKKAKHDQLAAILPVDVEDDRFAELFTHSAFAIDRTNPAYKGGTLADVQVEEKIKRTTKRIGGAKRKIVEDLEPRDQEERAEDLVEKLKRKTERMQRKRKTSKSN